MLKALVLAAPLALAAVFVAPFGGGEHCRQAAAATQPRSFNYTSELFFAVLEGLYVDGVSNPVVDAILARGGERNEPTNFVWGCPICMPAYEALRLYRARPHFESFKGLSDTFGPGLDDGLTQRVTGADAGARMQAIEELVTRWTGRRMDALRLDEAERATWQREMEMLRKKGMSMLFDYRDSATPGQYQSMKACAFCDGANGACAKR